MPTNYNGYTVPAPTDIADAPAAFEEFSDSIPFNEYVAVESLSAHTTVVDSYNGKMIFATADITLTFGTLTDGFSVAVTADTGVTVDYLGVDKASQQTTAYKIASVVAVNGTNIISIAVASTPAVVPQGKMLQVVRATDSTTRSTTSTSYSDTGLSVTITPTKNDSAIILIATCLVILSSSTVNDLRGYVTVTDNSNNMISGAQDVRLGPKDLTSSGSAEVWLSPTVMGYSTPATTSATTYKTRFRANTVNASITLQNTTQTAQLFAIEVSA